jgi:ABC-type molybdate transport system ATPase subunit
MSGEARVFDIDVALTRGSHRIAVRIHADAGIAALVGLSGGEAQRVAIGRALLAGPRVLLMDELLTALDAPRRAEVMAVIERIRDEVRLPILYVSHAAAEVERLATRVIEMD